MPIKRINRFYYFLVITASLINSCLSAEEKSDLSGIYTMPLSGSGILGHDKIIQLDLVSGETDKYKVSQQFVSDIEIGHIRGDSYFGEAIVNGDYIFISIGIGSKLGNEIVVVSTIERYKIYEIGDMLLLLNDAARQIYTKTNGISKTGVLVLTDRDNGNPLSEANRISYESLVAKMRAAKEKD